MDLDLHVVLVAPEIPPNAGNVARTCAALGAVLHLIRPLGFFMTDRHLRRAGLDYWRHVQYEIHDDWESFRQRLPAERCLFFTPDAARRYDEAAYQAGVGLVFGSESSGLPPSILAEAPPERRVRIPMRPGIRSLNLATAVGVAVYEAARRLGFPGLV
ncbi:MAG TPA: tRNA (cytidine(34)-2'-O)-methyltransferase [Bacillota bacterium]